MSRHNVHTMTNFHVLRSDLSSLASIRLDTSILQKHSVEQLLVTVVIIQFAQNGSRNKQ